MVSWIGKEVEQDRQLMRVVELTRDQRQWVNIENAAQLVLTEAERLHEPGGLFGRCAGGVVHALRYTARRRRLPTSRPMVGSAAHRLFIVAHGVE